MAMGKRRRCGRQPSMWVSSSDLPRSAGHPFYERLNRVLDAAGFDAFVEEQCAKFYADGVGRPSLVRISLKWITDSGDVDHGFRRSGTLVGA